MSSTVMRTSTMARRCTVRRGKMCQTASRVNQSTTQRRRTRSSILTAIRTQSKKCALRTNRLVMREMVSPDGRSRSLQGSREPRQAGVASLTTKTSIRTSWATTMANRRFRTDWLSVATSGRVILDASNASMTSMTFKSLQGASQRLIRRGRRATRNERRKRIQMHRRVKNRKLGRA